MSASSALAFDHIAVQVRDAESAYELFANVLELPLLAAHTGDDWGGAPWLMMIFGLADGTQVALCALQGAQVHPRVIADLPHCAFAVRGREQLDEWRAKLTSAGVDVRDEDHGDQVSIYFEDRSDLTWEITTSATAHRDPHAGSIVQHWIARWR
jgi:catechol 2,3-dioxygenase-like lactoylglutathione lyase family enzyme